MNAKEEREDPNGLIYQKSALACLQQLQRKTFPLAALIKKDSSKVGRALEMQCEAVDSTSFWAFHSESCIEFKMPLSVPKSALFVPNGTTVERDEIAVSLGKFRLSKI